MIIVWGLTAIAVASVSFTVTQSAIFSGMRHWAERRQALWGKLMTCPHCQAHWLVFAQALLVREPACGSGSQVADWLVTIFATIGVATMLHGIMLRAYTPLVSRAMIQIEERQRTALEAFDIVNAHPEAAEAAADLKNAYQL